MFPPLPTPPPTYPFAVLFIPSECTPAFSKVPVSFLYIYLNSLFSHSFYLLLSCLITRLNCMWDKDCLSSSNYYKDNNKKILWNESGFLARWNSAVQRRGQERELLAVQEGSSPGREGGGAW